MALNLPQRPAQYFIDEVLLPNWDPALAVGFDATVADPTDEAFLPVATSIDDVGAVYPSLIIRYSNETSGGESTYDFLTESGPGQTRTGELIATARAQELKTDYSGGASFAFVEADDLVVRLTEAVETIVQRNARGGGTEFETLGSQRGPDIPDDFDGNNPVVRLADVQVSYSWTRSP